MSYHGMIVKRFARRTLVGLRYRLRRIAVESLVTGGWMEVKHGWLRDSPHVAFLLQFGSRDTVDADEFRQSEYYRHGCADIDRLGSFFGIVDYDRIVERARVFHSRFQDVRMNRVDLNVVPGDGAIADAFPRVAPVSGSELYVIKDGHHRCAMAYVLGMRAIDAIVVDSARVSLVELHSAGMGPVPAGYPGEVTPRVGR